MASSNKRTTTILGIQLFSGLKTMPVIYTLLILCFLPGGRGWHDPAAANSQDDFHCWPSTSTEQPAYSTCNGVMMRWTDPPPTEIKAEKPFNCTYELVVTDPFYKWAAPANGFEYTNGTVRTTNWLEAKDYCENTVCPPNTSHPRNVKEDTCCVWHVNLHSCPINNLVSYCSPWIKPINGSKLYTHSPVLWGPVGQGNWTSAVDGLYVEGKTELIAHFKVGHIQMALRWETNVLPKTVCGDGLCEDLEGETCDACPADCGRCPLKWFELLAIALVSVLVVSILIGVFAHSRYKQYKLFWDDGWIIPYDEVKEDNAVRGFMGSAVSIKQSTNAENMFGGNALAQQAADKQVFCTTGIYNGKTIATRSVKKQTFVLTKDIRREVKKVRELDNPNVAKFIGGVITIPNVCVAMEYCPKGGLSDILLNDDVPLNWGFRFSFAGDIAKGMYYLHSQGVIHGRLKSNNCIVDDRWTVKLTDYGLFQYREEEWSPNDPDYDDYLDNQHKERRSRIYKAPETFSAAYTLPTPEADVYSFSIVLVEIATRNDPYGDEEPEEVSDTWRPPVPDFEEQEEGEQEENKCPCPKDYSKLVEACWAENPADRPDFQLVKRTLAKINPSQQSPVDMMMQLMEKYSKHLETLVGERTADLVVEKQKTDRLLYSMLPRAVADDLRLGKQIDAVWFDTCTIYFSDVVGFTSLSGRSTPYQVVALLNKLYTTFDSIIDSYDVYKVETIGDAYMVVSGVPVLNGIRHAHQVSCMSIDLVEACLTFVIPHLPDEPLKIRVGLHSGPVCAGVVGLKMPRYCLFGDTVNTASRMESNGEAYKIHISNFTYEYLQEIGGFKCEPRGVIPVKGKGDMKTWWLNGYDESKVKPKQSANDEIDEIIQGDGKLKNQQALTTESAEDICYEDLFPKGVSFSEDGQRKISSISAADSGYNEVPPEKLPPVTKQGATGARQRKAGAVTGPPPVNI